jgi:diaminopimelate epimerase
MARLAVTKCQGAGNDFVLLDRTASVPLPYPEIAQVLCDRNFGVGGDGLLVLERPVAPGSDVAMRIFNADGSQAEMCGNGVRCVARFMHDRRAQSPRRLAIETTSGLVRTEVVADAPDFSVRVVMGIPDDVRIYDREEVAGIRGVLADVVIGNPHRVIFVELDLMTIDLAAVATEIASDGVFDDGANVEVARVFTGGPIAMRVLERGVGETLACGTGACAVAIAAIEMELASSPVRVTMQGGEVVVDWAGPGEHASLTGGAEIVFDAEIDVPDALVASAAAPAM